jgi:hypothetical protein
VRHRQRPAGNIIFKTCLVPKIAERPSTFVTARSRRVVSIAVERDASRTRAAGAMAALDGFFCSEVCPPERLPADVRGEASYLSRRTNWGATRIERDPNLQSRGVGRTPRAAKKDDGGKGARLMQAVRAGPLDEVRELLEAGADTNMRDAQGNTALHKAAIAGSVAKAQLLVEHGANLELHNRFGRTALHEAANVGWPEVCGILVRLGSTPRSMGPYDSCRTDHQAHYFEAAECRHKHLG